MSAIKLDGITLANTANSKAVLDSAVVFPAEHVIKIKSVTFRGIDSNDTLYVLTKDNAAGNDYVLHQVKKPYNPSNTSTVTITKPSTDDAPYKVRISMTNTTIYLSQFNPDTAANDRFIKVSP